MHLLSQDTLEKPANPLRSGLRLVFRSEEAAAPLERAVLYGLPMKPYM